MKSIPESDRVVRLVFCWQQASRCTITTAGAAFPFIVAIDASRKFFDSHSLSLVD